MPGFFPLGLIIIIVVCFIYLYGNVFKTYTPRKRQGVIMILDAPEFRFSIGRDVRVFTPIGPGSNLLRSDVVLGVVEAQHGAKVRVSLSGNFERVDETSIREVINDGRPERVYKEGEDIPLTQIVRIFMGPSTRYAKIVQLYLPSEPQSE